MKLDEHTRLKAGIYSTRIKNIIDIVADFYGLKPADVCSRSRDTGIVFARQVAQYLAYRRLQPAGCSLAAVGVVTSNGNRVHYDHSTVLNSIKAVTQYKILKRNGDPVYPNRYAEIMQLESRVFQAVTTGVEEDMDAFARHNGDFLN